MQNLHKINKSKSLYACYMFLQKQKITEDMRKIIFHRHFIYI